MQKRNRRIMSCVLALLVIAVTAWFCAQMSCLQSEAAVCADSETKKAVGIGGEQTVSYMDLDLFEYTETVSVNAAHADTITAVKIVEQSFTLSEVPLSEDLQTVMQEACIEYNVPYSLALAIAEIESTFDVDADNGSCVGLMQINKCNHEWLRELGIEPTEHDGNIVAGVLMIGQFLEEYQDVHKALMAYNCGETGATRLWKQGYTTSTYSRKVMTAAEEWQQIIDNH